MSSARNAAARELGISRQAIYGRLRRGTPDALTRQLPKLCRHCGRPLARFDRRTGRPRVLCASEECAALDAKIRTGRAPLLNRHQEEPTLASG